MIHTFVCYGDGEITFLHAKTEEELDRKIMEMADTDSLDLAINKLEACDYTFEFNTIE